MYLTRVCIITLTYIHRKFDFWHSITLRNDFGGWLLWHACSQLFGWCVLLTDNNPNSIDNGNESNANHFVLFHRNLYESMRNSMVNLLLKHQLQCMNKYMLSFGTFYHMIKKIHLFERPLSSENAAANNCQSTKTNHQKTMVIVFSVRVVEVSCKISQVF